MARKVQARWGAGRCPDWAGFLQEINGITAALAGGTLSKGIARGP